ncbi:MAG: hypothetical protein CMJ18_19295, partial [Phycisphaeraceae bacterium]|nr:hypothetical protein [Phycisphaeraceae bacterium]
MESLEPRLLLSHVLAHDPSFETPTINVDGQGFSSVNPPDTVGDVGTNHYIQMVNTAAGSSFTVHNKSDGSIALGPVTTDTLAAPGSACSNGAGDPIVLYDQAADRWLISEFQSNQSGAPQGNTLCVYISQTNDPTNNTWFPYAFTTPSFPDYPKYGVWHDAYYVTTNENSSVVYAFDRTNMLQGNVARPFVRFPVADLAGFGTFQTLTPADLDGATAPPANAPAYFMRHRDDEVHNAGSNDPNRDFLEIFEFRTDFNTPGNSSFTKVLDLPVSEFDSDLCGLVSFSCFGQPGTATQLDPLREVILQGLAYRNFTTHETLLGNFTTDVDGTDHGGVRWFELRKTGDGPWRLHQEGTHSLDANDRWMGAIAMDGAGNIALGYNVVGANTFPGLRYAGRLATDPLGTLPQGELSIIEGTGSNNSNRWGDYASMSIDPVDDRTFWFTGEYGTTTGLWATQIASFTLDLEPVVNESREWTAQGPGPTLNGQVRNLDLPGDHPLNPGNPAAPENPVVGAIHTVVAHPSNPDILYIGATNGGVWRTDNATNADPSWRPLIDFESSLSIGALELDPTIAGAQTLVAGIGRYSSLGQTGGERSGLLRTINGGTTWSSIDGAGMLRGANVSGVAPRGNTIVVSVNVADADNLGNLGIFRGVDSGAGFVFSQISGNGGSGIPQGRNHDLAGDPNRSQRLYTSVAFASGGANGVYASDDTGSTWTKISNAAMDALLNTGTTNNVEFAVGQGGEVYVGILNNGRLAGFFRSDDATDGVNNDGDGQTDELDETNFVAMDIPRTLEGPIAITGATNASPIVITSNNHGLLSGNQARISGVGGNTAANGDFFVTVVNNNTFSLDGSTGNGNFTSGGTWRAISSLNPRLKPGGQGGIHFSIVAHPNNSQIVYVGGDRQDGPFPVLGGNSVGATDFTAKIFRGDASIPPTGQNVSVGIPGSQWFPLTDNGTASGTAPHADSREMVFDASGDLIEVNDGGINRRTSPGDATGDWFPLNGDLQVTELHDVEYDPVANVVIGGAQDTGTPLQSATASPVFDDRTTADGGDVAVDHTTLIGRAIRYDSNQNLGGFQRQTFDSDNNLVAGSTVSIFASLPAGFAPQFITPLAINAVTPTSALRAAGQSTRLAVGGSTSVIESNNVGAAAAGSIVWTTVATAAGFGGVNTNAMDYGGFDANGPNPDVLYVGSGSQVWARTAAGAMLSPTTALPGTPGTVTDVGMDPNNWQAVFAVDANNVYHSTNSGGAWNAITGNLATAAGNPSSLDLQSLVIVPGEHSNAVLVGVRNGVYMRRLDPATGNPVGDWVELGAASLPNTIVRDLVHDAGDQVLVAGTLGRGAWTIPDADQVLDHNGQTGDVFKVDFTEFLPGTNFTLDNLDLVGFNETLALVPDASNPTSVFDLDADGEIIGRLFRSDFVTGDLFDTSGEIYFAPSVDSGLAVDADTGQRGFQGAIRVDFSADLGGSRSSFSSFIDVEPFYSTFEKGESLVQLAPSTLNQMRLEQRLAFLGFPTADGPLPETDGVADTDTESALKLFQSAVDPDGVLIPLGPASLGLGSRLDEASGTLDPETTIWLNLAEAPRWVELIDPDPQSGPFNSFNIEGNFDILPLPDPGTGIRSGNTPQSERFGTSWLVDTFVAATALAPGALTNGLTNEDAVSSTVFRNATAPGKIHLSGMEIDIDVPTGIRTGTNGSLSAAEQAFVDLIVALKNQGSRPEHGQMRIIDVVLGNNDIISHLNANVFAGETNPRDGAPIARNNAPNIRPFVLHVEFAAPEAPKRMVEAIEEAIEDAAEAIADFGSVLSGLGALGESLPLFGAPDDPAGDGGAGGGSATGGGFTSSANGSTLPLSDLPDNVPATIGNVIDFGRALEEDVAGPILAYFNDDATPTAEELIDALRAAPLFDLDDVDLLEDTPQRLSIGLTYDTGRRLTRQLNFGTGLEDGGLMLEGDVDVSLDATVALDIVLGVDLGLGTSPAEAAFIQVNNLQFGALVDADDINLDAKVGFLGAQITGGTADLGAAVDVTVNDGNPLSLAAFQAASLTDLVDVSLTGNVTGCTSAPCMLHVELPVSASVGGFDTASLGTTPKVVIEDADLFDATAPDFDFQLPDDLSAFNFTTPTSVVGLLRQIADWLNLFRSSSIFDTQIPFVEGTTLGDAVDLFTAFTDAVTVLLEDDDGLPAFDDAEALRDLIPAITGVTYDTDFNGTGRRVLLYDFDFSRDFDDLSTTLDLDLLGDATDDLAQITTSTTVTLDPSASLGFTVGIDLSPLGQDNVIAGSSTLMQVSDRWDMAVEVDGVDDLTVMLRDGSTLMVNFDGLTTANTVDDVVGRLNQADPARFSATLTDIAPSATVTDRRIVMSDLTPATGADPQFKVMSANGSLAGLLLGLFGTDEDNDGVIEGGPLHGDTISDHVFIRDAAISGDLTLGAAAIDAAARFGGLLEIAVSNGSGSIGTSLGLTLTDPDLSTPDITLAEIIDALGSSGGGSLGDLVDLSVNASANLVLPVSVATAGFNLNDLSGASPSIAVSWPSVFTVDPATQDIELDTSSLDVSFQQFDELLDFKDFSISDIIALIQAAIGFVEQMANIDLLDQDLPLINQSVSDLLNFASEFAQQVEQFQADPALALDGLENALKCALGVDTATSCAAGAPGRGPSVPSPFDGLALSLDNSGPNPAIRLDLPFNYPLLMQNVPLNLDIPGLPDIIEFGTEGQLMIDSALSLDLDLGLEITDGLPRPFLYDSTGAGIMLDIDGSGLKFEAALGPLGIFVGSDAQPGSVVVDADGLGPSTAPASFTISLDDNNGDGRHYFDESIFADITPALTGAAGIDLPVFFPVEGTPLDATNPNLVVEITDLNDPIGTFMVTSMPDIANAQLDLSQALDALLGGLDDVFRLLQDVLNDLFGEDLPLIGNKLADAADFIERLKDDLISNLSGPAGSRLRGPGGQTRDTSFVQQAIFDAVGPGNLDWLGDTNGDGNITITDVRITADGQVVTNDLALITGNTDTVQFNMKLAQDLLQFELPIDLELGIPGLGLDVDGALGVSVGFDFDFGFGVSKTDGVFFDVSDPNELTVDFGVELIDLSATGALAFLQLDVNAMSPAELDKDARGNTVDLKELERSTLDFGQPGATEAVNAFKGAFTIDIMDPSGEGSLTLGELGSIGSFIDANLKAKSSLHLDILASLGGDANFPSIAGEIHLFWGFDDVSDFGGAEPEIEFRDIRLNMGEFFTDLFGSTLETINDIIAPVRPVLDILPSPIPVISDLAGTPIALVDLARVFGLSDVADFIEAAAAIADLLNIPSFGGELFILFGGFTLENGEIMLDATAQNFSLLGALGDLDPGVGSYFDSTQQLNDTNGSSSRAPGDDPLQFPILENPSNVFGLLTGRQDITLVTYDLPPFEIDFSYTQTFPIYPPLFGRIGGHVGAKFDVAFGLDTQGFFDFAESGDVLDIFNGLFISDRKNADGTGEDVPELLLTGGLTVGAELNLGVAKAGADGGIFLTIEFDLHDNDNDGKVRINEIVENFLLGPIWIFDVGGKIEAGMSAFLELGPCPFCIEFTFDLPRIELASFELERPEGDADPDAIFASKDGSGKLTVNIGPNAAARVNGNLDDVDDNIYIRPGNAPDEVRVAYFDEQQTYTGVTSIYVEGGAGADMITVDDDVSLPVELWGGFNPAVNPGMTDDSVDHLTAGRGDAILHGNGGNDVLVSLDGNDKLFGEEGDDSLSSGRGNDTLEGGVGMDTLDGGVGEDDLFGGDDMDTMFGGPGSDEMFGGLGDDKMFGGDGGDQMSGGDGDDEMDGGDGLDTMDGDAGDDTMDGGLNNDTVRGGEGADLVLGGGGNDTTEGGDGDDRVYGNGGSDVVRGGPGDDILVAGNAFLQGTFLVVSVGESDSTHTITGGDGDDTIHGELGFDDINGGEGDNTVFAYDADDLVVTGSGNDTIDSGPGDDTVHAGDGDNTVEAGLGADDVTSGAGIDYIDLRGPSGVSEVVTQTVHAGDGMNIVYGDLGDDTITTGSGPDQIYASHGANVIDSGDGDDLIESGDGVDIVEAAGGDDVVSTGGGDDEVMGGDGDDIIDSGAGEDVVFAEGGDDTVSAGPGNDRVFASAGNDEVDAGDGNDLVVGANGHDVIFGQGGDDVIWGGLEFFGAANFDLSNPALFTNPLQYDESEALNPTGYVPPVLVTPAIVGGLSIDGTFDDGNDVIRAGPGRDFVFSGGMADDIDGGADEDYLDGGVGPDLIHGGGGDDVVRGGANDDNLFGDAGIDQLYGDEDDDILRGDAGRNEFDPQLNQTVHVLAGQRLYGNDGHDRLFAYAHSNDDAVESTRRGDELHGGSGNDFLHGNIRREALLGGTGNDYLHGESVRGQDYGNNVLADTSGGGDFLFGDSGEDLLFGGGGADRILGGANTDMITGQDGQDYLFGGSGIDIILLDTAANYTELGDVFDGHFGNRTEGDVPDDNASDIILIEGSLLPDSIFLSENDVGLTTTDDLVVDDEDDVTLSGAFEFRLEIDGVSVGPINVAGGTVDLDDLVQDINTELASALTGVGFGGFGATDVQAVRVGDRIRLETRSGPSNNFRFSRETALVLFDTGFSSVLADELHFVDEQTGVALLDVSYNAADEVGITSGSDVAADGVLSGPAQFDLTINGVFVGPIVVGDTSGNGSIDDLLVDLNQALAAALGATAEFASTTDVVVARRVDNRVRLETNGLGRDTIMVLSAPDLVARNELHLTDGTIGSIPPDAGPIRANWRDTDGTPLVEQFRISGLGGDDELGFVAGPSAVDFSQLSERSLDWVGVIDGGSGDDLLLGSGARDRLDGGRGSDLIFGFGGDDRLWGDTANGSPNDVDVLFAGAGNDDLIGGLGTNRLYAWSFDPSGALHFDDGQAAVNGGSGAVLTAFARQRRDGRLDRDVRFALTLDGGPEIDFRLDAGATRTHTDMDELVAFVQRALDRSYQLFEDGQSSGILNPVLTSMAAPRTDGVLATDLAWSVSVDGAPAVAIDLDASETADNLDLDDLVDDINLAIAGTTLAGTLTAGRTGGLVTLDAGVPLTITTQPAPVTAGHDERRLTLRTGAPSITIRTDQFGVFVDDTGQRVDNDGDLDDDGAVDATPALPPFPLEDTGLNRMLGMGNDDRLYGGTALDFLYGNGGDDLLFTRDGVVFDAGFDVPAGDEWKEYAKATNKVWYYSGTGADDVISVDFVTEPGLLSDHHLITRLTENNGNFSFDAQVRLDFQATDDQGELIWDPMDLRLDLERIEALDPEQRGLAFEEVALNGGLLPPEGDFLAIIIDALAGRDRVEVGPTVQKTVWIDGGPDDDVIEIRSGNAILVDQTEEGSRNEVAGDIEDPSRAFALYGPLVLVAGGAGPADGVLAEVTRFNLSRNGDADDTAVRIFPAATTDNTTFQDLVDDVNDALGVAGLDGEIEAFDFNGEGRLALRPTAGEIDADGSLTVTSTNDAGAAALQLSAGQTATAFDVAGSVAFNDLTLDNPADVDWYSFRLASNPGGRISVRSASVTDDLRVEIFREELDGSYSIIRTNAGDPQFIGPDLTERRLVARDPAPEDGRLSDPEMFTLRVDTGAGNVVLDLTLAAGATDGNLDADALALDLQLLVDAAAAGTLAEGAVQVGVSEGRLTFTAATGSAVTGMQISDAESLGFTALQVLGEDSNPQPLGSIGNLARVAGTTIHADIDVDRFLINMDAATVAGGGGFLTVQITGPDDPGAVADLLVALWDTSDSLLDSTTVLESVGTATLDLTTLAEGDYVLEISHADAVAGNSSAYEIVTDAVGGGDHVVELAGSAQPTLELAGIPALETGVTYFVRVRSLNRVPTIYDLILELDGSADPAQVDLGARSDLVRRDVILGGAGNDVLIGGPSEDWIFGGPDNDVLSGGLDRQASDLLFGGDGDDLFQLLPDDLPVNDAGETLLTTQSDRFDGGDGFDRVLFLGGDFDRLSRPVPDRVAIRFNRFLQRYEFTSLVWDIANQRFVEENRPVRALVTATDDIASTSGVLSGEAKFNLSVNGAAAVIVRVTQAATADNQNLQQLLADLNAALDDAG